jgi:hypothetical protein
VSENVSVQVPVCMRAACAWARAPRMRTRGPALCGRACVHGHVRQQPSFKCASGAWLEEGFAAWLGTPSGHAPALDRMGQLVSERHSCSITGNPTYGTAEARGEQCHAGRDLHKGRKQRKQGRGFTVGIRIRLILNQFLAVAEDDIAICIGRLDRERVVVQVAARVHLREWHAWIGSTSSNMSTQTNAKRGWAYPGVGCEARLHDHIDAVTAREYERERANDCTHPLEKGPLTAGGAQDVDAG